MKISAVGICVWAVTMGCSCDHQGGYAEIWRNDVGRLLESHGEEARIVSAVFINGDEQTVFLADSGELILVDTLTGQVQCRYQASVSQVGSVTIVGDSPAVLCIMSSDETQGELVEVRTVTEHGSRDQSQQCRRLLELGSPSKAGPKTRDQANEMTDERYSHIVARMHRVVCITDDMKAMRIYRIRNGSIHGNTRMPLKWGDAKESRAEHREDHSIPAWKQFQSISCADVSDDGRAIVLCGQYGQHWFWRGMVVFAGQTGWRLFAATVHPEESGVSVMDAPWVGRTEDIVFLPKRYDAVVCVDDYGGVYTLDVLKGHTCIRASATNRWIGKFFMNVTDAVGIAVLSLSTGCSEDTAWPDAKDTDVPILEVYSIGGGNVVRWKRTLPMWVGDSFAFGGPSVAMSGNHEYVVLSASNKVVVFGQDVCHSVHEWSACPSLAPAVRMSSDGSTIVGWERTSGEHLLLGKGRVWCWSRKTD